MRTAIVFIALSCCGVAAQDDLAALVQRLRAADEDDVPGCVAAIGELGRGAVSAAPKLLAMMGATRSAASFEAYCTHLGEMLPYRAVDALPDARSVTVYIMHGIGRHHLHHLLYEYPYTRFVARLRFPHAAPTSRLIDELSCCDPLHVEAAVDVLGARGAAARAALPALAQLLARPAPRILPSDQTTPLLDKVARALAAIAPERLPPEGVSVERARRAFDIAAPSNASRAPARALARIDELVADLSLFSKREAARENLIALGGVAAPRLAAALTPDRSTEALAATIEVLDALGPRAVAAVPAMIEALSTLDSNHTAALVDALAKSAPYSTDVVLPLFYSASLKRLVVNGTRIRGVVDAHVLNTFKAAYWRLHDALLVDPNSTLPTLEQHLGCRRSGQRERALIIVQQRGSAARPLLPTLVAMMHAEHPSIGTYEWQDAGGVTSSSLDPTAAIQRLAAETILKVAAPDAPEVVEARKRLDEGR